jgi:hypothetical protein
VLQVTKHALVPLTYVGMGSTPHDPEYAKNLASFRAALTEDLRDGRKTVVVLDLRRATALSTSQRWMTGLWMKEVAPLFERTTFGTVFIVESALVRGVLSTLLWVQPKGTPYAIVRDQNEAVLWALECMENAGVDLSVEMRPSLQVSLQDDLARLSRDAA